MTNKKLKPIFVTFGQVHRHEYANQVYDKDCVGVIYANSENEARESLFKIFGAKFCFTYTEENWEKTPMLTHFPDGYRDIPFDCEVNNND